MWIVGEGAGEEGGALRVCGEPWARGMGPAGGWRGERRSSCGGAAALECGSDGETHLGRVSGGEEACERSWGARGRRHPRR